MRSYLLFLVMILWTAVPALACKDGVVCSDPLCPQISNLQNQERNPKRIKHDEESRTILNAVEAYLASNDFLAPFPVTSAIVQDHPDLMSLIAERILQKKTVLTTSRLLRVVHHANRELFRVLFRETYLDLLSQTAIGNQSGCILFVFLNPTDLSLIKEFIGTDLLNQRTQLGNNLAHYAAIKGKTEALEFFAQNAPSLLSQTNDSENNPLHLASHHGHSAAVRSLLLNSVGLASSMNAQGETPFLLALRSLNEASVSYFRQYVPNNPDVILAFGQPRLNRTLFSEDEE